MPSLSPSKKFVDWTLSFFSSADEYEVENNMGCNLKDSVTIPDLKSGSTDGNRSELGT